MKRYVSPELSSVILQVLFATLSAWTQASLAQALLPGSVAGTVYCGDTGRPCRFTSVLLHAVNSQAGAKATTQSSYSASSTLDGSFQITGVQPGAYYVTGQLPGYLTVTSLIPEEELRTGSTAVRAKLKAILQTVTVEPNQRATVSLRLDRGAAVGGTIRYDDGSPAVNVIVSLYTRQKNGTWGRMSVSGPGILGALGLITTDDLGHFRKAGLSPGEYTLGTSLPSFTIGLPGLFSGGGVEPRFVSGDALQVYFGDVFHLRKAKPVVLGVGEERNDADIVIPTGGLHSIQGLVTAKRDGHALSVGTLQLLDAEDRSELRKANIREDGSFTFGYVASGSYLLRTSVVEDKGSDKAAHGYGEAELRLLIESDVDNTNLVVPDKFPQ